MSVPERPKPDQWAQPDAEVVVPIWWSIAGTLLVFGGIIALFSIIAYALGTSLGYCIAVGSALLAVLLGSAIWKGLDLMKAEADKTKADPK